MTFHFPKVDGVIKSIRLHHALQANIFYLAIRKTVFYGASNVTAIYSLFCGLG